MERLTFSLDCHPTFIPQLNFKVHQARLSQPIENVCYHEEWIKAYLVTGKDYSMSILTDPTIDVD